jgi:hypothetical protein
MHLLAAAGEEVLTPSVGLKFVTPEVSQNHLSCFGTRMIYTVLLGCKIKQTKPIYINGHIHLLFMELSIINFGDIKMTG